MKETSGEKKLEVACCYLPLATGFLDVAMALHDFEKTLGKPF